MTSALYIGKVTHQRFRPKAHRLGYRVFNLLVDLDEGPELGRRLRLFGFNRPALLSFHESDHGDGTASPLKAQIEALCRREGLAFGGPVQILCLPRVLGYVFNPISLYFVHDADGALSAIVHEVNNTFGGRCFYALPAQSGDVVEQAADKRMYVSPFMDMDYRYRFQVTPPGERFSLSIQMVRDGALWLTAGFAAQRRPLEDRDLLLAWLTHPLVTLKVMAAIHVEALRIWLKGVGYRPQPKPSSTTAEGASS